MIISCKPQERWIQIKSNSIQIARLAILESLRIACITCIKCITTHHCQEFLSNYREISLTVQDILSDYNTVHGCTHRLILASWLQENGVRMRKWWGNRERMRNGEEIWREWGYGERFTPYISSFSLYFFSLYPFPISKIVSFCRKMLNTPLLSRMSQKTYHVRYR